MGGDQLTVRGVRAAVGLAEALGLRVVEPVVARVATSTAMARQPVIDYFRRAEEVSRCLAARGVPVVGPSPEVPAGPHLHDGFAISFAAHVRHDPDWTPEPADLADPDLGALWEDLARRWSAHTTSPQALHGDAHPGNLLRTAGGPVWNDFEDTWRGPVAWDLACLSAPAGSTVRRPSRATRFGSGPPTWRSTRRFDDCTRRPGCSRWPGGSPGTAPRRTSG